MKIIKYIISFFVLFLGILIIGESYTFHLNNFETKFANTTLYLQPETSKEEMLTDILSSADQNDVEVFSYIKSVQSTFLREINVYGTPGVEKDINNNLDIAEKEYTSLFLGTTNFKFNDIQNIPNIEKVHDYYLIGSKEDVHQFKMDLINKYAGNHPKEGYKSNELRNNIVLIWLLIGVVVLLLSYYDIILQRKENLIKVSMGERISKIVGLNILIDCSILISLFISTLFILSKYTNVYFNFYISLLLFCIILLLNSLLYLILYIYNIKEVFSNSRSSNKLLTLNYILKIVTVVLTIFIFSTNIISIVQSYNLYKQKSFFDNYADYYYTNLDYKIAFDNTGLIIDQNRKAGIMQESFYRTFFEKFDATLITNISNILNENGIYANKNSFNYLSDKIKELNNKKLTKDYYFLLSSKRINDSMLLIEKLNDVIKFYEGKNFTYNYEVIFYEDNVDIIRIDELNIYGSELVKNPVIIYNNISANMLNNQIYDESTKSGFVHDIMYRISDDEFSLFIKEYNLTDQFKAKTNVLETYQNHWRTAKSVLYINSIFSILVLLLELMIISSIIKLEYEVNAVELCLKKVMGQTLFQRNMKILLMTIIMTILSILSAVIIAKIFKFEEVQYLAVGGIIIFIRMGVKPLSL